MKRRTSTSSSSKFQARGIAFIDQRRLQQHHHHQLFPKNNELLLSNPVAVQPLFGIDRLDFSNNAFNSRLPSFPLAMSHPTMEEPSSLIATSILSSTSLLARTIPVIFSALSYLITSLTSLLLPMAAHIQRAGETMLAAFFLLSLVQAMVALYQYRYDVRGQLVFPDGLTIGTEDYYCADTNGVDDTYKQSQNDDEEVTDHSQEVASPPNRTEAPSTATAIDTSRMHSSSSWVAQTVKKLNKSLVLLLPWITRNVHNLLTRNTHLFHIGFIVFILDSILPLMLDGHDSIEAAESIQVGDGKRVKNVYSIPSLLKKIRSIDKDPIRILVIGDSLSIGIGCIEHFDATKDNSVPMTLVENTVVTAGEVGGTTKSQKHQGPVFPQVLARTLSYHFKRPVQWRSAGVDGGDCYDIRSFCMDVVKEECTKKKEGHVDIVVALFGLNDLKKQMSLNPLRKLFHRDDEETGTIHFRRGMDMLLSDIHSYAPDALVVFPALPIQPYHKNSIINIFPLGLMVDSVMGLWERQKKIVASSRNNAMYVELKAQEIADWYSSLGSNTGGIGTTVPSINPDEDGFRTVNTYEDINDDDVLLSADGVHPNKRLYAKWAELVGHKLYKHIIPTADLSEPSKDCLHPRDRNASQKLQQVPVKKKNLA